MIATAGLSRRFGGGDPVVDAVDLEVRAGEVVGLLGPNGGGKSTLLLLLAGLVRPTAGEVRVRGVPAHELPTRAAGAVGLITAEPGLYPALTARENLAWFAGLSGRGPEDLARDLPAWADALGIAAQLDRPAAELSSGQRQKVSLLRALLLAPSVLLFDEPTANLDPLAARAMLAAIRAAADRGLAVVLCTHDLRGAARVCDRLIVLDRTIRASRPTDRAADERDDALHAWLAEALGAPSPVAGPSAEARSGPVIPAGVLHVARREWLEAARHPTMLAICAGLLAGIAGIALLALGLLDVLARDPDTARALGNVLGGEAAARAFVEASVPATLTAWNFLVFSQYLGFVGVVAGHALLHDRQVGTLPFLLLAPIPRGALLAGKVLGALGPLTAIYLAIAVGGGLVGLAIPSAGGHPELGPRGAGWWLAVLVAVPCWGAFVGGVGAAISARAREVRLAQQAVWGAVFGVQLVVAFLVTGALHDPVQQLVAAGLGAVSAALALAVAASALSRDLAR